MRTLLRCLCLVALTPLIGCGGGIRLYSPRCDAQYQSCTDACAPRCEPTSPDHANLREASAFEDDELAYTACNACVKQCQESADQCEQQAPAPSESPFQSPSGGEPGEPPGAPPAP